MMFRLEQIGKSYQRSAEVIDALDSVSTEIAKGDFVAIVGPSGSGKSTLLSILGGMLTPTTGKLWLDGKSLYDLGVDERAAIRRLKMGFVFQTFNLIPYLSALENVEIPLLLSKTPREEQQARATELLDKVGLGDRARHKPCELSTGQQQRVALARTLVNNPEVIFADEPTGNLDPESRNNVLNFLDQLHREGKTIILVTHDQYVARRASWVLQMDRGHVEDLRSKLKLSA